MLVGVFVMSACSKKKVAEDNENKKAAKTVVASKPPPSSQKPSDPTPEIAAASSQKAAPANDKPPVGGAATPEALGLAYVAGFNNKNRAAVNALFAPANVINSAIDCPNANRALRIERERIKTANEISRSPSTTKITWGGAALNSSKTYVVGQTDGSCTFKKPVETNRIQWRLNIASGSDAKEERKMVTVIRVDARWYLVDL